MDLTREQPEWGIKISKYFVIPQRIILSIMCATGLMTAYNLRVCISIAMTRMVVPHNRTAQSKEEVCPIDDASTDEIRDYGDFDWSEEKQGFILSSFFIGYIIGHLPGGLISEKYGGKWVLGLANILGSMLSILTPTLTLNFGAYVLISLRIALGLIQGGIYPAVSGLISHWVPLNERGTLGALAFGGAQLGSILANTVSGSILRAYKWQYVFYFVGVGGAIWSIIYVLICFSSPNSHPFIKPSEREYLNQVMPTRASTHLSLPWRAIMTSLPMWSLLLAQIGHDWGLFVVLTDLPKYLNDIVSMPIAHNGGVMGGAFFSMWMISVLTGFIADILVKKNIMSLFLVRVLMTVIAAIGPAVFLMLTFYSKCNYTWVLINLILAMGTMGTYYAGIKLTCNDMSPNHAPILMAISNCIGAITGVVAPTSIGYMTQNSVMHEWRNVFWVNFAIMFITVIPFCIWGTAEVQAWDDPNYVSKKNAGEA